MDPKLKKTLTNLKFVVFDFDGVFTDNAVYVNQEGVESVRCHRSDGLGLSRIRECGVETLIISTEPNPVVFARAKKLKMEALYGIAEKGSALTGEVLKRGLSWDEVAFVGNDINDLPCLELVGLPVVVADAYDEVLPLAKLILKQKGGEGAVREFCDLIWNARKGNKDAINE
jgi:3-deoxy-D-manno-octulosonate 8-phosphate phosphatase (KDO 8-P phosphatase)